MTIVSKRISELKKRLATLNPTHCEVIDDSHLHVGHEGAKGGASHLTLKIASPQFAGLSLIQSHKLIYQTVGDMIPNEIHALKIQLITQPS